MTESATNKPANSNNGLKEYFTLWLETFERLMEERDKRYEARFKAADEKTSLALASSDKALSKAEAATEKRFEGVNEFRDTLRDQAGTFITRSEVSARNSAYDDKLETIRKEIQFLREANQIGIGRKEVVVESKNDIKWGIGIAVAIGLNLIGLLYNILK